MTLKIKIKLRIEVYTITNEKYVIIYFSTSFDLFFYNKWISLHNHNKLKTL